MLIIYYINFITYILAVKTIYNFSNMIYDFDEEYFVDVDDFDPIALIEQHELEQVQPIEEIIFI